MHTAFVLAPVILAAVLIFSGLAKLPDPDATHSMMSLLRLPGALVSSVVARAVPWVELTIAVLLLTPWRWTFALGAAAAVLLMGTFWVIIARAMTFDPRPSCGCFGRVGDYRITGRTVARNSLLLALALLTAGMALTGHNGTALLAEFTAGDWWWLLLAVVLAVVTVLILGPSSQPRPMSARKLRALQREQEELAERQQAQAAAARGATGATGATGGPVQGSDEADPEEDYIRSPIPKGVLVSQDHQVRSLRRLPSHQAQLLILVNCWCGSTMATLERVPAWRERLPQLGVPVVHTLPPWQEPSLAKLGNVWWDPGSQVYDALQSGVSPAAVLLGADGLLAGGPVNGPEEIEQFVEDIAEQLAEAELPDGDAGVAEPGTGARGGGQQGVDLRPDAVDGSPTEPSGVRAPNAP